MTDHVYDGGKNFLETLDKLIMEENYLSEQIFNMDETSLYWKRMPERRQSQCQVSRFVSAHSATFAQQNCPVTLFLGRISIVKRRMTVLKQYTYSPFVTWIRFLSSTIHI
jgi:hypothetical protein